MCRVFSLSQLQNYNTEVKEGSGSQLFLNSCLTKSDPKCIATIIFYITASNKHHRLLISAFLDKQGVEFYTRAKSVNLNPFRNAYCIRSWMIQHCDCSAVPTRLLVHCNYTLKQFSIASNLKKIQAIIKICFSTQSFNLNTKSLCRFAGGSIKQHWSTADKCVLLS